MNSRLSFAVLAAVLTFAATTHARKDPGEYWASIMKEEPMPEAVEGLLPVIDIHQPRVMPRSEHKTGCHDGEKKSAANNRLFADDFEPRPNISAYGDDAKLKENKSFVKDFEPRPNVSAYGGDNAELKENKPSFAQDFEPRPNVSAYGD